ncbi:hypothetical protein [Roseomonas indoligenes]|uniref:Uncharacterized protein n=1 Tax=Roseomonas indoligenes TaxID=2820811 RepID=A0A940MYL7_9PROT|nr:hypothetical protein [Pararoseomonas indoligenes]MBP0492110.1 hypothetical protein [Pararoseomonas indoligenes]
MSAPAQSYQAPLRAYLRSAVKAEWPQHLRLHRLPVEDVARNAAILDAWASEMQPTAGEIAASMSVTRNAVLAVVRRARLRGDARAVRRLPRPAVRSAAMEPA